MIKVIIFSARVSTVSLEYQDKNTRKALALNDHTFFYTCSCNICFFFINKLTIRDDDDVTWLLIYFYLLLFRIQYKECGIKKNTKSNLFYPIQGISLNLFCVSIYHHNSRKPHHFYSAVDSQKFCYLIVSYIFPVCHLIPRKWDTNCHCSHISRKLPPHMFGWKVFDYILTAPRYDQRDVQEIRLENWLICSLFAHIRWTFVRDPILTWKNVRVFACGVNLDTR